MNNSGWQRITTSDSGWLFRLIFLFFRIRDEPTIKHPIENSLNLEEDLGERLFN